MSLRQSARQIGLAHTPVDKVRKSPPSGSSKDQSTFNRVLREAYRSSTGPYPAQPEISEVTIASRTLLTQRVPTFPGGNRRCT